MTGPGLLFGYGPAAIVALWLLAVCLHEACRADDHAQEQREQARIDAEFAQITAHLHTEED